MGNLKKTSAILILITIVLALTAANAVHALGVTATVTVGNLPGAVAYDSAKGEIFVANEGVVAGTSTISVISDSNNTAVATIPVGEETLSRAGAIAYDSGKGEIFVTLETATGTNPSSSVSVISDSTNAVVANINVGNNPDGIDYDSGKGEIFVANGHDSTVSVISDSNNTVVATIPVGNGLNGVAYDSGKGEIFVANQGSGTVSVISDSAITSVPTPVPTPTPTPTLTPTPVPTTVPTPVPTTAPTPFTQVPSPAVVANVHVGNYPFGVAYDSGKGEIFVTNNYDNTVSVISDSNNTVVAIIPVEAPYGVAYDSGKSETFVTNTLFEPSLLNPTTNFISNTVSVISDSSNTSASPASPAPATSVSPTTVPEFSTEALILAMVLSGVIVVTFVRLKSKRKAFS